ncbi:MAG: cytochrome c biogenesis protein CcdA [Ornithinimicrobium sp.]|uniref:cytochrome c biogenesis CcdA family protein n=1 Tax=Ornithinimicrobium sp. TaxID=1977084 RepID=UPI0026E0EEDB|nr:cytochrome c biogenesis protein CcdA [Ornithinimicrobium sp.]MDO5739234.1 cytochrome c biogenesis protein CcdA [Ornithinimicrobium sp.]
MNDLVLTGPLLLAIGVAALAGLVSFASPCVLPLVPGYLGYLGGMSSAGSASRGRLAVGSVLFVLGFTAVFLAMSVVISGLGLALTEHQGLLLRVAGLVVTALGLVMMLQPSLSWQVKWRPAAGLAGAPLLGIAFGLGFTACTGPALVAIQTLGTSILPGEAQVARALVLGAAYSLGLGVPFLLVAAGLGAVTRASRWMRQHYLLIQRIGGGLLVAVGLLMVSGVWAGLTAWVQAALVSNFETVL